MSSPTDILEDQSKLSWLDRTFFKLESLLNLLGGIVIFLLVFLATANVLGRWLFNMPVNGYIDWVEQAMAFMAFLGIAYTKRLGGHIRMDILVSRLHGAKLWLVELLSSILQTACQTNRFAHLHSPNRSAGEPLAETADRRAVIAS